MADDHATRILLVDDHTLFRESLRRLLESEPRYTVVAEVSNATDAIALCRSGVELDLALIDYDLGPAAGAKTGVSVLRCLRERQVFVPSLMITAGIEAKELSTIVRDLRAGVFLKADPASELQLAIQKTLRGDLWLSSGVALSILSAGATEQTANAGGAVALDARERKVLGLVVEGLSNKEISSQIHVPETTVKAILQKLFEKVGVRTRAQLVRFAFESEIDFY
jgi:DNA-binding NarL/FixJ family response regulator